MLQAELFRPDRIFKVREVPSPSGNGRVWWVRHAARSVQHFSRGNPCMMSMLAYSSWGLEGINWSLWMWMASCVVKPCCSLCCLWITELGHLQSPREVELLSWPQSKVWSPLGFHRWPWALSGLLVRNCRDVLKAWHAFSREMNQFGVYFWIPWNEVSWCILTTAMCNPDLIGFFRSLNLCVVRIQAKIQGILCF